MSATDSLVTPQAATGQTVSRAESVANGLMLAASVAIRECLRFIQFGMFLVYLVISVVGFWVWVLALSIGTVRLLLKLARRLLLSLSLLNPPPRGWTEGSMAARLRAELRRLWDDRFLLYADVARPVGRQLVSYWNSARNFWHLPLFHKLVALFATMGLVLIPLLYVVPRPHYVQIMDRNALWGGDGELKNLIHAVDLADTSVTREYENEYAFYLGKINPQGLKAGLQQGRFYRLMVVGLRWNWLPKSYYPNIISAKEVNIDGTEVENSNLLSPLVGPPPSTK